MGNVAENPNQASQSNLVLLGSHLQHKHRFNLLNQLRMMNNKQWISKIIILGHSQTTPPITQLFALNEKLMLTLG